LLPVMLDGPFTPVAESLERLEEAVSPLAGIVRDVAPAMWAADEPRLHSFACELASSANTTGCATPERSGSAHVEPERAKAASIGEAIERYGATYVPDGLVVAAARELDDVAAPESFALFHERQHVAGLPFVRFSETTRLSWVTGFSLDDGRPVLLPAQLVYLGYVHDGEPPIGYPTSNGLACGPTLAEAVVAGLLELVERDAMMIVWSNRLSLPRLTWEDDSEVGRVDAHAFAPTALRYATIDTSAFFGIPATIGIVHGVPGELAALAVGAGCARSVVDAWRTSLAEGFSILRWLRGILLEQPRVDLARPGDVRTLEDHMLFYATPERAVEAGFLEASDEERDADGIPSLPGETPGEVVAEIVERLAAREVSAYAVDITPPDVDELGLKVARVVTPQLCALDVFGAAPYRGGERRYRAAFEAGLAPKPLTYDELNPLPHPFP
jgi:ribosomal protein S12 methylthiotransferase accessory factor